MINTIKCQIKFLVVLRKFTFVHENLLFLSWLLVNRFNLSIFYENLLYYFRHYKRKKRLSSTVNGCLSKTAEPEVLKEAIYVVNDNKYFIETSDGKFEVLKSRSKNDISIDLLDFIKIN